MHTTILVPAGNKAAIQRLEALSRLIRSLEGFEMLYQIYTSSKAPFGFVVTYLLSMTI